MQPLTYVLKTLEKQAQNGSPLVTLQCVPALDMKMLLRRVPRPPSLTYVLLTYVLAMPDKCGVLPSLGPWTEIPRSESLLSGDPTFGISVEFTAPQIQTALRLHHPS